MERLGFGEGRYDFLKVRLIYTEAGVEDSDKSLSLRS